MARAEAAISRYFVERLISAPGSRRYGQQTQSRSGASPPVSWPSSSTTTAVQPPRPPALADGDRRLAQLCRGADRAARRHGSGSRARCGGSSAFPTAVPDRGRRLRERGVRPGRDRDAHRPGAGDARRPDRRRARGPRRDPLSAKRGGPPHRCVGDAAAALGVGELELPPRRRAGGRDHGHLLDEQPPAPRAPTTTSSHSTSASRSTPIEVIATTRLRPSGRSPTRVIAAQRAPRRDRRAPDPNPLLRRLLALGLPRGRLLERASEPATEIGEAPRSWTRWRLAA